MLRLSVVLTWAFASAGFAFQSTGAALGGPLLGLVLDAPSGVLLPVHGVPGAAAFGEPLEAGARIVRAAMSPRHDSALAVADDGRLLHIRLLGGSLEAAPVDGLPPVPDRIEYSPSGSTAALSYAGKVELLRGLPEAPCQAGSIDLTPLGSAVSALAVSDDGAVLAAFAEPGGSPVFLAGVSDPPRLVLSTSHAAALAFAPGGADAIVADDRENTVQVLREVSGAAAALRIAGPEAGIAGPTAVALSAGRAYVANAGSGTVAVIDLVSGVSKTIACGCRPSTLAPLAGGALRLTEPGDGPLWLLDADRDGRPYFIPARAGRKAPGGGVRARGGNGRDFIPAPVGKDAAR
jgi:YVTN family beta-propeller protein